MIEIVPVKGAETHPHADALWRVACGVHLGEKSIGTETRIDPATKKPRTAEREVDGEVEVIVVEFPVYGERVGFQPDCPLCQATVLATRLHIIAFDADRMQADFEFERETARREAAK